MVLVSGFAVHPVFAPAHPWACLLRSIARAVCPSAPQGCSLSPRACLVGFCCKFRSWLRMGYKGYRPNGL